MNNRVDIEFCYWPIKFRCEYIRWMLAYLGQDFRETSPKDANDWGIMKTKLTPSNPLINLPFLRDNNSQKVISESEAISFAVALRFGGKDLLGRDGAEAIMIRGMQEQLRTIRRVALNFFGYTKTELAMEFYSQCEKFVVPKLVYLDNQKKREYNFLMGALSIADFELAHLI